MNFSDPEFMQYVVKTLTIGQLELLYLRFHDLKTIQSRKHIMEDVDSVTQKARKVKPITLKEIREFDTYLNQRWP